MRDIGRRRRWRGWFTAVLLAACVDGPTSPGLFGELRIRPSYPDGDAPTVLELSVDSAKVRVVRSSEPTIVLVDTMVRYESDTASMGWVLTLRENEELLLVDVAIWDDGGRVYSGEGEVVVREAAIAESGAEPVLVAYVGPPIVKSVTVSPENATLEALNATASFAAEARDRHGEIVSTAFEWTSEHPNIATVDVATGAVTAVGNGTTTIHAAAGSATGAATVVVSQRVAAVRLTPENPVLTALGATSTVQASVSDANGFTVAGATVTWSSSDEAVARVDEAGTVTAVAGGAATITAISGGVEGTTRVTVNPVANVASVTVAPASALLSAVGATAQFTAEARDASGNVLTGVQFVWMSTEESVATVVQSGVATAVAHGASTIVASAGSVSGRATLTVDLTTTIASIAVAPANVTLTALGATQQFTAEARDASGAVVPGVPFTWASSATEVATIGEATALATVTGNGSTTITASANDITGTAALIANLTSVVASVVVVPANATLTAIGATQQFTAEARDASGSVVPGMTFTWSSSSHEVATIDEASGLATVTGNGSTTITASANDVSGAATLTSDLDETITSIAVSPASATLTALGATQQFTAVARDANSAIITGVTFTWSSSNESAATIDPSSGLATAVGHGSMDIVATIGDVQGSATLTVNLVPIVRSIVVTPATVTLASLGATQHFTAEARDANGAVIPGVPFTWTSSVTEVATVGEATGLATVAGNGSTSITASANDASGTATLTADLAPTITSIVVSPTSASLTTIGAIQQFTAVARDANNTIVPGVVFTWSSSNESVATIDPATGLATAAVHGSTTILATIGDVQGSATLTVNLVPIVRSIIVTPATVILTSLGATQHFTAEARDANGAVVPGIPFTWTSSVAEVATIGEATGLATVTGNGSTTITATAKDVAGTATLTANLVGAITSIVVAPANPSLTAVGATQQFTAVARDASNTIVPGVTFIWSSSDESVATTDPATGLATAASHGSTNIVAAIGDVQGSASLTVDLTTTVASIVVSPHSATLYSLGVPQQFSAVAYDAGGEIIPGIAFRWTSSATDVATVHETTGLATSVGNGLATITAMAGDVSGAAQLTVQQRVVRVDVTPAEVTILVGDSKQLTATAYDANDRVVLGRGVSWWSSDTRIATVDANGLVEGIARGTVTIKAFIDDVRGTSSVTVACAPPPEGSHMLASIIVC